MAFLGVFSIPAGAPGHKTRRHDEVYSITHRISEGPHVHMCSVRPHVVNAWIDVNNRRVLRRGCPSVYVSVDVEFSSEDCESMPRAQRATRPTLRLKKKRHHRTPTQNAHDCDGREASGVWRAAVYLAQSWTAAPPHSLGANRARLERRSLETKKVSINVGVYSTTKAFEISLPLNVGAKAFFHIIGTLIILRTPQERYQFNALLPQ